MTFISLISIKCQYYHNKVVIPEGLIPGNCPIYPIYFNSQTCICGHLY